MKSTKSTNHLGVQFGYLVCQNISNCTCASKEELMRRISSRIIEVGKVWSTWTFDDLVTCQFCQFCSKSICGCCRAMVRTCAVWTALRKGNLSWHLLFRVKRNRMDQIWPDTLEVRLWSTQIVHLSFLDQHKSCRHNPSQQELRNLVWKAVGDAGMELEPEMGLSFGEGRGRCYWGILGLVGIHRDTMRNFGSCELTALQRPFLCTSCCWTPDDFLNSIWFARISCFRIFRAFRQVRHLLISALPQKESEIEAWLLCKGPGTKLVDSKWRLCIEAVVACKWSDNSP